MNTMLPSVLLALSAACSLVLGATVIWRNPYKNTHRVFAVLALDLMLWALGVLAIIHCHTEPAARFWVRATFLAASLLPAMFYQFIAVFPRDRFEGSKSVLGLFYLGALGLIAGMFTPWYLTGIQVFPEAWPEVRYGPVFSGFGVSVAVALAASFINLIKKLRTSSGIERRQIQYVILGIFASTGLASTTNVLAPILHTGSLEPYGPTLTVLMAAAFAYAMVRYHLLDIWVIISRTAVYAVATGFVVVVFLGTFGLIHWILSDGGQAARVLPTLMAALIISLGLQPLKEWVQLVVDRVVLKRHFDAHRLLARISQKASRIVHMDELLHTVAQDIVNTVGITRLRILLLDEKEPSELVIGYSTTPGEQGAKVARQEDLVLHVRARAEPLLLEQLLRSRPSKHRLHIAQHLAELDAYLCVPLITTSGLIGLMTLGAKTSRDMYSTEDLVLFTALAGPLATAIENARLYQKLEEANLHRARILSSMRGAVIAVDTEGRVSTVNQGAVDMLGPVKAGSPLDALPSEVGQLLRQTLEGHCAITDFETMIVRPDGEKVPVVISSSCLQTKENQLKGAMATIYDLTQVKKLEQDVQRADRLLSLGTLAAGMAHEIKNPLVSIKTFTQLLPTRYNDPDFRTTFADIVPHEVDRIDSIVTRLLHFAHPSPAVFAPQNLRVIIDEIMALVENQLGRQCIAVVTEFPDQIVPVRGDEQQLHQAFLNLILNAMEAMRDVEHRVLHLKVHYGTMRLRPDPGASVVETECIRVVISDTGCGIPKDKIEHIFTPFYTTKEDGAGLGLSVVHRIVTEHEGQIDVSSTPHDGTTFVISLPVARSMSLIGMANS